MSIRPIKSIHITNYYHKNSGGISTSYNHLLEYANIFKRPVRLIVPAEKDAVEEIGEYAKIYYLAAPKSPFFDKRYRVIMPWQFILESTKLCQILISENPDLIEICDKYSLSILAAKIRKHYLQNLGRPVLVHFSCERMDDNISAFLTKAKFGNWLARQLMGNYNVPLYDFYIANSSYTASEYMESVSAAEHPTGSPTFFNWCRKFFLAADIPPAERLFICSRGGIDPVFSEKNFSHGFRREFKTELGIEENSRILFYAGRISPEKNIGILLDLMEILKKDGANNFTLLIAGDGPAASRFKREAEQRIPGSIKFLGHLTDKRRLALFYANCDIFIHPNPKEPLGIGPLEAMASGIPIAAPNSGGILSYANEENSWLIEPTAEKFAAAVKEILEDDALRKRKIANALKTAGENNWEKSSAEVFPFMTGFLLHLILKRNFLFIPSGKKSRFFQKCSFTITLLTNICCGFSMFGR